MTSEYADEQRERLLLVVFFLQRLVILSIKNLSCQDQIEIPESFEQWIDFEFPAELIEKIQSHEDRDFICKAAFQKQELTYWYLIKTLDLLDLQFYLHLQCLPLLKFLLLYTKHVMQSEGVYEYILMRYIRLARNLDV